MGVWELIPCHPTPWRDLALPAGLPQGTVSDQTQREGERACDQTANDHTPTSRAVFGVPLRQAPLGAPKACLPSPPGSQDPTWVPVTFPGPAAGPGTCWEEEEGSFGSRGEGSPCWGLGGALRFPSGPESGLLSVLLRVRGACAVLAARRITDLCP